MTERAFPFDAGPGADSYEDRWQKMARRWLATGVIPSYLNSLAPSANGTALAVAVATGGAWIEGFYYETDAALTVNLAAAHASLPRIDRIVVRLDRTANTIVVDKLTGTAASSPSAPALTQTDTLWEMLLADVAVAAAVGVITSGNVTDRRTLTGDARLILKSQFDAKGDLLVGTTDDAFTRKAVGADGSVLTADSSATGGVAWTPVPKFLGHAEASAATGFQNTGAWVDDTVAVPFTAPPSGAAVLDVRVNTQINGGNSDTGARIGYHLTGASTVAADDARSVPFEVTDSGGFQRKPMVSWRFFLTGLTPLGSYTATLSLKGSGGWFAEARQLSVEAA